MTATLQTSLLVTADTKGAQAALVATAGDMRKVSGAAGDLGARAGDAGSGVAALSGKAGAAAPALTRLSGAERQAAAATRDMGRANHLAAGSVGNLTAQFNDIGVMLASGQNPLQLALQQGTQITQVIGPLGAGGAVKALGAAFLQMLNPVSLITIGSIAAGAAMFQWLTAAGDEALTLEDAISELEEKVAAYEKSSRAAGQSTAELTAKFGAQAAEIRALLREQAELDLQAAQRNARAVSDTLQQAVGAFREGSNFTIGAQVNLADLFDLSVWSKEARGQINTVLSAFDALDSAGTLDQQIAAAEALRTSFRLVAEASGDISTAEGEVLGQINAQLVAMRTLAGLQDQAVRAAQIQQGLRTFAPLASSRAESDAGLAAANELLASLRAQNTLQAAISEHGRDSNEVARLRADAERVANEEMLAGLVVAESVKDGLRKAFEEGQRLAALDLAAGISAAGREAQALADKLGLSLKTATSLAALGPQGVLRPDPSGKVFGGRGSINPNATDSFIASQGGITPEMAARLRDLDKDGRGRGKSEIERQRDALARLIAQEQRELDLLRETDPLRREMLRNREALAGATEAERLRVEALIGTRLAEEQAARNLQDVWGLVGDQTDEALGIMIAQGKSAGEVIDNLVRSLLQASIQASLFGTGPLAGIFGFSGSIFGGGAAAAGGTGAFGLPLPFATGGPIRGPGSGTSDDVLIAASNGEFMVNAAAAARHRHLLEAINAGSPLPRFATGGVIGGGGAAASPVGAGGGVLRIDLADGLVATILSQAGDNSLKIMQRGLTAADRRLPDRVQQISSDRRVRNK